MTRERIGTPAKGGALILGLVLAALLVGASITLAARPAHADLTFTVNSVGDAGSGGCNSTECTLREAIALANRVSGADTIRFDIPDDPAVPGNEVRTISPTSELPDISEAVTIDGYTQPGASPNTLATGTNAVIKVQLAGSDAVNNGLEIVADDVTVRGLAVGRFDSNGIEVDDANGDVPDPTGVGIEGNFIGTDASGTQARPNGFNGLNLVDGAGDNTVGGTSPDKRNLISGNGAFGVNIIADTGFAIEGNLIGTKKDGSSALGNDSAGVNMSSGTSGSFVGGFSPAAANTIAFNGGDGVNVVGDDALQNRILSNSIFSNGGLGIDLDGGTENAQGATANDPRDVDAGSNDLQNKPAVSSATTTGTKITIKGTLNSTPNSTFTIQYFSNLSSEPSGIEGKRFLGQKNVTTNANGNTGTFTRVLSVAVPVGQRTTATATDASGDTSEFSAPRTVSRS